MHSTRMGLPAGKETNQEESLIQTLMLLLGIW
jgi:hypothetical protein